MIRYLLDGGPRVVALLAELRDDLDSNRWDDMAGDPASFPSTPMVSEAQSIRSGAASHVLPRCSRVARRPYGAFGQKRRRPGPPTTGVAPPGTGGGMPT